MKLLNNQLTKPEILIQRIALIVVAIVLAILVGVLAVRIVKHSDPYVKEVLSLVGDWKQGNAIFQLNSYIQANSNLFEKSKTAHRTATSQS